MSKPEAQLKVALALLETARMVRQMASTHVEAEVALDEEKRLKSRVDSLTSKLPPSEQPELSTEAA